MTPQQHQALIKSQIFGSYNNQPAIAVKTGMDRFSKSEQAALDDMIEKGEIADTLASGYGAGSQPMIFKKTGKEIKEKVPGIIAALTAQKAVIEGQLNDLQVSAGIVPDQQTGRKYSKTTPYQRYEWKICEPAYVNGAYAETTEQNKICSKYNSLVWVYNDILDDLDAIAIIEKNVEDSKAYDLSVSQLIALTLS